MQTTARNEVGVEALPMAMHASLPPATSSCCDSLPLSLPEWMKATQALLQLAACADAGLSSKGAGGLEPHQIQELVLERRHIRRLQVRLATAATCFSQPP